MYIAIYAKDLYPEKDQIVNKESYPSLDSIQGQGIHYYITSPRWTYLANNSTLNYIRESGTCIAVFHGQSTQEIEIYYISNPL
jgi:hypothetical protein